MVSHRARQMERLSERERVLWMCKGKGCAFLCALVVRNAFIILSYESKTSQSKFLLSLFNCRMRVNVCMSFTLQRIKGFSKNLVIKRTFAS